MNESKTITRNIRFPKDLLAQIKELASKKHWSTNYFVVATLEEKVRRSPSITVDTKKAAIPTQNNAVAPPTEV